MAKQRMNNSEINQAFKVLINQYERFKKDVEKTQNEVQTKLSSTITNFDKEKAEIKSLKNEHNVDILVFKKEQEEKLNKLVEDITGQKQKLDDYYQTLFGDKNSIENVINELKTEIKNYHSELLEGDNSSESIQEKISGIHKEIVTYKKELFGYQEKGEDKKIIKFSGIKDKINELIQTYNDNIKTFNDNTDELIENKTEEMNILLEKMGLNYNAVEQEALSKKFFKLSKDKGISIIYSTLLLSIYSILLTGALMYLFTSGPLQSLFSQSNIIAGSICKLPLKPNCLKVEK